MSNNAETMLEALQARYSFSAASPSTNALSNRDTKIERKKHSCFAVELASNSDEKPLHLLAVRQQERALNTQIMQIRQDIPNICPLPNAPPFCLGLVNIRGALVPVFDISAALRGISDVRYIENISKHLLIVGSGQHMAAFCIASLPTRLDMRNLIPIAEHGMQHILSDCI
ncbi:MAG: chemotaxis protein CheW, partial [Mariprofundales bacterium]